MYPKDLKYTREHEWARVDGATVAFGITSYAQEALGDIVFVTLPEVGQEISAGEPCGEVESTKSVSEIYAPVSGRVMARNETLVTTPEMINSDPYGEGWLVVVTASDPVALDDLLDAEAYEELVKEQ